MTWPHGEAEDLLGKYAWFVGNSATRSHPVGELRPNDLGLADVLGNAWEWCQDRFGKLKEEEQKDDKQDVIDDKSSRLLRSASFYSLPLNVRSANRRYNVPSFHDHDFGFRPARTLR